MDQVPSELDKVAEYVVQVDPSVDKYTSTLVKLVSYVPEILFEFAVVIFGIVYADLPATVDVQ